MIFNVTSSFFIRTRTCVCTVNNEVTAHSVTSVIRKAAGDGHSLYLFFKEVLLVEEENDGCVGKPVAVLAAMIESL